MMNLSIALRYNGWLRIGWISFPLSCVALGLAVWYFSVSIDDYRAALLASYLVEVSVGCVVFSVMPIVLTKNGRGTLETFRKSMRRIENNKIRIAAGIHPLRSPWQVEQWAATYCQRAGVVAAARELNVADELPPHYQRWWVILDTRSRIRPKRR